MITCKAIADAALKDFHMHEDACELVGLARELDGLRERLASDSRTMSERFARYAEETASGAHVHEPPTGWSTLRDMDRDAAKYAANLDAFKTLLRIITGKPYSAVRASLEENA